MKNSWFKLPKVTFFFLVFLVLATSTAIGYAIHSRATYNETGSCYETKTRLTNNEMRLRVIRNFLAIKVAEMRERNEYGFQYQTALVHKRMTEADVIESIRSASILDFEKSPGTSYIKDERDIENLDPGTLQDSFTIIQYSALHRVMEIILGDSIEAVDSVETTQFFEEKEKYKFKLDRIERFQGYGNFLYKIKSYGLDLACCDKLGDKYGKSAAWHTRKNIELILWTQQHVHKHLIVSNCGKIMSRSYEGDVIYLF